MASPVVANTVVVVSYEDVAAALLKVEAGGQAGLAGSNDQCLDVLRRHGQPPYGRHRD